MDAWAACTEMKVRARARCDARPGGWALTVKYWLSVWSRLVISSAGGKVDGLFAVSVEPFMVAAGMAFTVREIVLGQWREKALRGWTGTLD